MEKSDFLHPKRVGNETKTGEECLEYNNLTGARVGFLFSKDRAVQESRFHFCPML